MAGISPEALAARFTKWADKGLDYALVVGAQSALERDRAESIARVHSRTGNLASTVRLTSPSAALTSRRGFFRISLVAGSKSKGKPVPYAGVLQDGRTSSGATRTKAHWIPKAPAPGGGRFADVHFHQHGGVKLPGGAIRLAVFHPGSRLVAQSYLRIDEKRAAAMINFDLSKSLAAEIG